MVLAEKTAEPYYYFCFSLLIQQRGIQLTVKSLQQNLKAAAESFQRVSSEVLEKVRSTSVPRQRLDMVSQSCVCLHNKSGNA